MALPTLADFFNFLVTNGPIPVGSLLIGMIGSLSYYISLRLGFLQGEKVLSNLQAHHGAVWFVLTGGLVALVFQLAQLATFAPVQSFVLGITWPTLISQYLAGKGKPTILDEIEGGG